MKLITEIKLKPNYKESDFIEEVIKKAKIKKQDLLSCEIVKMGIDARRKPKVYYVVNVAIEAKDESKLKGFQDYILDKSGLEYERNESENILSPIVVGFGPSGMFASLTLAKMGFNPIVIEQGKCVEERQKDVEEFWKSGRLNTSSNVQFGEGGAGTFSDGKLNSNISNVYCKKVINEFIELGAPKDIFYKSKPHIGSDNLRKIVVNLRKKVEKMGGKVHFNTKFIDFEKENDIYNVKVQDLTNGNISILKTSAILLCLGHSARDTFELLNNKGLNLKQKPFAMGVRIEQMQKDINIMQYGTDDSGLPSADYKLAAHLENGRSVFTFCNCPGGVVVASSSESSTIVTNGMSNYKRDEKWCNSALLVNVLPSDFGGDDALAGVRFQDKYERLAFELGGSNYNAPAQNVISFIEKSSPSGDMGNCSYKPNIRIADIEKCLPDFVAESLRLGLIEIRKKYKGFANDNNMLVAIESRSSCPLQIVRDESFQSSFAGIFPVGEGAGYAGGIMTSAVDGIIAGEKVKEFLFRIS